MGEGVVGVVQFSQVAIHRNPLSLEGYVRKTDAGVNQTKGREIARPLTLSFSPTSP